LSATQTNDNLLFKLALYYFTFCGLVTTFTDLDWKIIPDQPIVILFFVGLLSSIRNPIFMNEISLLALSRALTGAAVGSGVLFVISVLGKKIMSRDVLGWGDIKLLGAIGTFLGPEKTLQVLALGSILGGIITIVGISLRMIKRSQYIPFAPFLNVASIVVLLGSI
jgi:leader peptidase (prepilin peptidase)/N-methyltransferase